MDFANHLSAVLHEIPAFGMLATFQFIDIVSGLSVAAAKGRWNSSISRPGMARKAGMLCLVGAAMAVEHWMPSQYSKGAPISAMASLWLSFTELLSIVENADELGIWLPNTLKKWMRERRKLTQKQIDKAFSAGLNIEFAEITANKIDSHAETVRQQATVAEVKADSVIVKNKTNPNRNVIQE